MLTIAPVTLSTGRLVLRPLTLDDAAALAEAASDGALWEKKTTTVPRPARFRDPKDLAFTSRRRSNCRRPAWRFRSRPSFVTAIGRWARPAS